MRYVLIVNPAAGKKNPYETVLPPVHRFLQEHGIPFVCHLTQKPGHAISLSREEAARGDEVRIYAFGGDGTLAEVAAGAAEFENAEIGIFPCGSGNDYIKMFGPRKDFLSVEKQLMAVSRRVDLIRSELGISINLCSVGMDATVALEMARLKRLPLISGPAAYNLALLKVLFGKIGEPLRIRIDDREEFSGCFLFAIAASGQYYGGGYCGAPLAVPNDGLLDFVLIRKPPVFQIPKLAAMYKAGRHIGAKEFEKILTFRRGKKLEIFPEKPAASNRDGEVALIGGSISFEVFPSAVRFLVPKEEQQNL